MHSFCCSSSDSSVALRLQAVLHLVPEQHLPQRLLDDLVRRSLRHLATALGVQPVAEENVVADRDGQWVRALEDHSDLLAHLHQFDLRVVDVLVHDVHAALDAHVTETLVDAVDAAQEGALAASRGTDHRGDQSFADAQVDVVEGLEGAVPEIELLAGDGMAGNRLRSGAAVCWLFIFVVSVSLPVQAGARPAPPRQRPTPAG
jgi:hypothetical protein